MEGGVAFAGQAAGIGIAIVFAFLTLMSLLMVAMRRIDELAKKSRTGEVAGPTEPTKRPASDVGAVPHAATRVPEWAIAAAVVYLESEEERERHRASAWTEHRIGGGR
jgi:Na+-transporting methylmalonyl-CoA/oxaloacetate decarboxylase gamma subunit